MLTERFTKLRKNDLSNIFEKKTIIKVWKEIVRGQLRNLDFKDLYDYYDFNYNIEERAETIRNEIISGSYKVSQPLIYRIEKKYGICRHLVNPQPSDALVFQVLVEDINDQILKKQPSKNAFYSRDKHSVAKPHSIEDSYYNWHEQWKRLQKKIYNFNEEKEYIVVTDLTNYYDSIDLNELRKVLTSYTGIKEVVIDLIFKIIEDISWKPDYLPYSRRGLPTTNIEGVRLLAHSFLFEIDEVLKQKTNNSFTRWMDDITIGVESKKQAIETISEISDMLKSRGLALNVSKTNIYNAEQGYFHFQIEANRYIDSFEINSINDENYADVCSELDAMFERHFTDQSAKYWDKVAKRYITTFAKLKSMSLLNNLDKLYLDYPGLRQNLLYYLATIGYNDRTAESVLTIIQTIDIFDDRSLYLLCNLVTQWEIPSNNSSSQFLAAFEKKLVSFSIARKIPSDFYCLLWFKSKYDHPEDLLKFIRRYQYLWQTDSFSRRQVSATLSRLLITNNIVTNELLQNQISSGIPNTVTLANQILLFSKLDKLDNKLSFYLFPQKPQRPYPLSKFLVLCSVLNSEHIRQDPLVKEKIKANIHDPYYLKWLDAQYNIR